MAVKQDYLKLVLERFDSQSLQHQVLASFIAAIVFLAVATSLGVSFLSARLAVQRSVEQGISITNALAKNSTLALLYASEDNAQDALIAALAFPGVIQVAISELNSSKMLKQNGEISPWMVEHFTKQPGKASLEYETNDYWQFGALVQLISGTTESNSSPLELAHSSTENIGRVHLLVSKKELKALMKTIVLGNFSIAIFLCFGLFLVLKRMIRHTTEPFSELAEMMQQAQQGKHGLRMMIKGSSELRHIGASFNKMMDVLEIRENELVEARDIALESSRLKSEFVANISHEIRTPMNGVLGMLNLLDEKSFSIEDSSYIKVAKESGEALLVLINSILDFSKLSAEKVKLENSPINLPMLIENNLALHSATEKKFPIEMGLIFDPSVPVVLWGDSTRLQQLINNLVSNAIKFTEQGEVSIAVELQELNLLQAWVLIRVKDTGIGIPSEFCDHVFDPYSQQDGSISRRFGGTGLGLAICKRLVELMGGNIHVDSVVDMGSCFSLSLPFKVEAPQTPSSFNVHQYFDHLYLIAPAGFCSDVLINVAQNWKIGYTCVDTSKHWLQDLSTTQLNQRLGVIINHPQLTEDLIKNIVQLKAVANVCVVNFYNSILDRQENMELIDVRLVKPVRRYALQDRLEQYFTKKSQVSTGPANTVSKPEYLDILVLVVEDNVVNQKVAKAHLEKLGLRCDLASNGQQAVHAVTRKRYDLILMDCQMPLMDGYEATRQIRTLSVELSKIPIIALSANSTLEDQTRCVDAGMNGFIGKPFTRDQLAKTLAEWIPAVLQHIKLQRTA